MRRRLLVSTLVVAVTAVLLLGLPLAFVLSRLQISAADQQVQRDATTVARTLQDRVNSGLPADVCRGRRRGQVAAGPLHQRPAGRAARVTDRGSGPAAEGAIIRQAVTKDFRVTVAADNSVEYGRLTARWR